MSVSLDIQMISDPDIQEIRRDPLKLDLLYFGEDFDNSLLAERTFEEQQKILNWKPEVEAGKFLVGNTFQSITYILTGKPDGNEADFPFNFLTAIHNPVGEIGWGPVNFYTSTEVKEISRALLSLDLREVELRFNADDFNKHKIYPGGKWVITDLSFVMQRLKDLMQFMKDVSEKDLGVYLIMN